MKEFRLTREQKGDKFVYTVTDERGNVISTRTSKSDFVACTANGEFYFGRLDLIGGGDHGECIFYCHYVLSKPQRESEKYIEYLKERLSDLNTIVYLSK